MGQDGTQDVGEHPPSVICADAPLKAGQESKDGFIYVHFNRNNELVAKGIPWIVHTPNRCAMASHVEWESLQAMETGEEVPLPQPCKCANAISRFHLYSYGTVVWKKDRATIVSQTPKEEIARNADKWKRDFEQKKKEVKKIKEELNFSSKDLKDSREYANKWKDKAKEAEEKADKLSKKNRELEEKIKSQPPAKGDNKDKQIIDELRKQLKTKKSEADELASKSKAIAKSHKQLKERRAREVKMYKQELAKYQTVDQNIEDEGMSESEGASEQPPDSEQPAVEETFNFVEPQPMPENTVLSSERPQSSSSNHRRPFFQYEGDRAAAMLAREQQELMEVDGGGDAFQDQGCQDDDPFRVAKSLDGNAGLKTIRALKNKADFRHSYQAPKPRDYQKPAQRSQRRTSLNGHAGYGHAGYGHAGYGHPPGRGYGGSHVPEGPSPTWRHFVGAGGGGAGRVVKGRPPAGRAVPMSIITFG